MFAGCCSPEAWILRLWVDAYFPTIRWMELLLATQPGVRSSQLCRPRNLEFQYWQSPLPRGEELVSRSEVLVFSGFPVQIHPFLVLLPSGQAAHRKASPESLVFDQGEQGCQEFRGGERWFVPPREYALLLLERVIRVGPQV